MSEFSFFKTNFLNTTTLVTVDSGTGSVYNLFDRNEADQYSSVGKGDDTAGHTIGIEFPSSRNLTGIVLQNINLKGFRLYYNSNSANTFTFTSTTETTTSLWTQNSSTSLFLQFSTQACTSVFIDATTTISANEEKKIGQIWLLEKRVELSRNPDARSYKAKLDRREFVHELSGGGWASYIIDEYFSADIRLNYWDKTETADLLDLYDDRGAFVFAPFPTGTAWYESWYEDIYECIWQKDFEFKQPAASNFLDVGFRGTIRLRETAR